MTARSLRYPLSYQGVDIKHLSERAVQISGPQGVLDFFIPEGVRLQFSETDKTVMFHYETPESRNLAATFRVLFANDVQGVLKGYEKRLIIGGVGYRAQMSKGPDGRPSIQLSLGYSHPVDYVLPEGVSAETPAPTEIVIRGIRKAQVGQVAADIRAKRPPNPYKANKGIRYSNEVHKPKETKKKK